MNEKTSRMQRSRELIKLIDFFEERYGGAYQEVVIKKGDPFKSEDWQWCREGKDWKKTPKRS